MSGAHAAAHLADIDGYELIAPKAYGERGIPHDQWTELRQKLPLRYRPSRTAREAR